MRGVCGCNTNSRIILLGSIENRTIMSSPVGVTSSLAPKRTPSRYNEFIRTNQSKVAHLSNPQERMKELARMWNTNKGTAPAPAAPPAAAAAAAPPSQSAISGDKTRSQR